MMDPAIKGAVGLCVLLVGASAAMMFRHSRPQSAAEVAAEDEVLLRWCADSGFAGNRLRARQALTDAEGGAARSEPGPAGHGGSAAGSPRIATLDGLRESGT